MNIPNVKEVSELVVALHFFTFYLFLNLVSIYHLIEALPFTFSFTYIIMHHLQNNFVRKQNM